jgi:CRISPR-associated protein Csm1
LPRPLDPDALEPAAQADGGSVERAYSDLWRGFTEGWRAMAVACAGDAVAFEEGALDLSERFFWAVPSSTVDQPDVSLHDHARVVSAVAACLCAHHAARGELADPGALTDAVRPRLRFLVADLSGLQNTLFRFRAEGVAGRNRILRGRSFRFQLIADAAARRVRDAFALPAACVLQAAGGKVLMLLPDLGEDATAATLDPLRAEIDDWMARQYLGDLGLGLAVSPPFATRDLVREAHEADAAYSRARAKGVRDSLRIAVETAKLRQLERPATAVLSDLPIPYGPCVACGVKPARVEGGRCPACDAEHELGQALPHARAVVIAGASPTDFILGLGYALPDGDASPGARGWRLKAAAVGPAPIRFAAAHVALFDADTAAYAGLDEDEKIEAGGIKTFAALARDARIREPGGRARGVELLGVLKADVDRLGALFATGLGDEAGLARPAQLSRMLDAYFTGRLTSLLATEFPDSYTVYAGGDDLMIVAPWRACLRLAARLRADFAAFAGGNPSVTLSAGVALADPRAPLSIAAGDAEDRLQRAKDAGRDRISAIEAAPMTWGEYERALAAGDRLDAWLAGGRVATGALYKFLAFDDARARIAAAKPHDLRAADLGWRARLGYHLARMLPDRARREDQREIAAALLDLFGLDDRFADRHPRPGARLALSAALYANR